MVCKRPHQYPVSWGVEIWRILVVNVGTGGEKFTARETVGELTGARLTVDLEAWKLASASVLPQAMSFG